MTKPTVWVQFAGKKNRVDDKNLLHLKYTTSQKIMGFLFSVLIKISFHELFRPVPNLNWYAARLNPVHLRYIRSIFIAVFLWEYSFRQLLTLQLNLKGVSPDNEPKKQKQTNKRRNVESMDRSWKFEVLRNSHYSNMFT